MTEHVDDSPRSWQSTFHHRPHFITGHISQQATFHNTPHFTTGHISR